MRQINQNSFVEKIDWKEAIYIYKPLHVRYRPGELIYQTGTYAAGVYLIAHGLVTDQCVTKNNNRHTRLLEIFGPGDLIGLDILIKDFGGLYVGCARTIIETDLYFFEKNKFLDLMQEQMMVKDYCIDLLLHRLYSIKQHVSLVGRKALVQQMRCLLLSLAQKCGEITEGTAVLLPPEIKPPVLAFLLGISNAKASRVLNSLSGVSLIEGRIALFPSALSVD